MNRRTKQILLAAALLVVLFFSDTFLTRDHLTTDVPENSSFEVHYIDVGQGDAELIICDGHAMLIDGGNVEDSSLMYSYLEKLEVDELDCVVCTHPHEDHVGGLSGALSFATADTVYCSYTEYDSDAFSKFLKVLGKQGLSITVPSDGDSFYLGSALVQIFGPLDEYEEVNDNSIVLKVTYGKTSFLFMGDAMEDSENDIMDSGYDVNCTVLKVGHHGSETSTSYRFIYLSEPKYAVISCGKDNSYNHPNESVISRLTDADVTVYRTDNDGTVICKSDGENVNFSTEKDG